MSQVQHENIIRYHESFVEGNPRTLFIVMDFASGGDLAEKLKNQKRRAAFPSGESRTQIQ